MKKLFTILVGALALGPALAANAGPDRAAMDHERTMPHRGSELVHAAALQVAWASTPDEPRAPPPTAATAAPPRASAPVSARSPQCSRTDRLVLPLDHGPRADTTPYLNRLRKDRHDAQSSTCKGTSR